MLHEDVGWIGTTDAWSHCLRHVVGPRRVPRLTGPTVAVAGVENRLRDLCYNRYAWQDRKSQAMIDMAYDPEADAVSLRISRRKIDRQEERGPFVCDVDV